MDQPIEDRIRHGRILEVDMPLIDGQLTCDQRRLAIVTVIEDLEEISPDCIGQWRQTEVVNDDEIGLSELTQERGLVLQRGMAGELVDEPREPEAADAVIGAAGGMANGAGDVALA